MSARSRASGQNIESTRLARRGEVTVATALLALGLVFGWMVWRLPDAPGYSQVGPKVVPAIAALGLIATAAILLVEAVGGGFANRPDGGEDVFDRRAFAWLAAGLVLHMVLVGWIGFVPAATLLFVFTARGLGSRRLLRDVATAMLIALALYSLFTGVLGLSLGPTLGSVLGRAP